MVIIVSDLGRGGAERQVIQIANGLNRRMIETHIIALSDNVPLAPLFLRRDGNLHIRNRKSRGDISVIFRVASLVKRIKPDIVHTFLFDAEIIGRIAKFLYPKFVLIGSERNTDYEISPYRLFLRKVTSGLQDYCIANSNAGAAFNSRMYSIPVSRYRVVRNGVDTNYFSALDSKELPYQASRNKKKPVIGMFASFKKQKNHVLLIEAAYRLIKLGYDFSLLFVGGQLHQGFGGSESYAADVQQAVERFGLTEHIKFLGPQDDLPNLYNTCDIVVLPSFHEGVPNVILEAQSCGVPCIVTDISDNKQVVEHGVTGYVFPVNEVGQLVYYLNKLLSDEHLRRSMGEAARRKMIEEFSNEVMIKAIESVYMECLTIERRTAKSREAT